MLLPVVGGLHSVVSFGRVVSSGRVVGWLGLVSVGRVEVSVATVVATDLVWQMEGRRLEQSPSFHFRFTAIACENHCLYLNYSIFRFYMEFFPHSIYPVVTPAFIA